LRMFVILILHQMMPGPAPAAREAIAAARASRNANTDQRT
jgi:hypothetical protein